MAININSVKGALGVGMGQASIGANGAVGPIGGYAVHTNGITPPLNPSFGDLWSDGSGSVKVFTQQGWISTSGSNNLTAGSINASTMPYDPNSQTISNGSWAVAQPTLRNVIEIETKVGRVGINTETGDITIPPGIGRDEAIREFWFGFQKHFQPSNKAKYEQEIVQLNNKMDMMRQDYAKAVAQYKKDAAVVVAEKVRKKYGNEKFIMIKPEDLIKFIEG